MSEVSVIGIGTMGSTIARLLLGNGYRVTVWNRTSAKAEPLVRDGAVIAPSAASTVGASPIVVVCVHDYKATNEILGTKEIASALDGRVLVQLTTGSPQEARDSEVWARERGADYLDGAIQAAPEQMGKPDTTILVSGSETAFRRSEPILNILGGNVTYLGEKINAASAMDLATLSYVYGSVLGFFMARSFPKQKALAWILTDPLLPILHRASGSFSNTRVQSSRRETSRSPKALSVSLPRLSNGSCKQLEKRGSTPSFRRMPRNSSRKPWRRATKTRNSPLSSKCCARAFNKALREDGPRLRSTAAEYRRTIISLPRRRH